MYQVLARKWRPKTFHEMVGQQHVRQALSYALDHDRLHHAYLFTGTRGVGKTTIARIFAKSLNCLKNGVSANPCGQCEACREIDAGRFPDLIEVDAASRTGVDDTRELLDNVPYAPVKGRSKVYLIDEVHMFSKSSFNALLKTLEEPPPHVKFILATTDPQKLPATVLSRCLQFHLKNMTPAQVEAHLRTILNEEKVVFEEAALSLLAEAANGSMRDGLSLMDQAIAFGQGEVRADEVASLLGAVPAAHIQRLFAYLSDGQAREIRMLLAELDQFAPDYPELLRRVLQGLQQITIAQLHAARDEGEIPAAMRALAVRLPVELVQLWYQIATDAWQNLPYQPDPRTALEMTLLRMIALQPILPTQALESVAEIPAVAEAVEMSIETAEETKQAETLSVTEEMPVERVAPGKSLSSPEPLLPPLDQAQENSTEKIVATDEESDDVPPWQNEEMPPLSAYEDSAQPYEPEDQEERPVKKPPAATVDFGAFIDQPDRWGEWLKTLSMDDETLRVLGENSCPVAWDGTRLTLAMIGAGMLWASDARLKAFSALLAGCVTGPFSLELQENDTISTPVRRRQAESDAELARAQQAFENDPAVVRVISQLGARIEPGSVYSLKNSEKE